MRCDAAHMHSEADASSPHCVAALANRPAPRRARKLASTQEGPTGAELAADAEVAALAAASPDARLLLGAAQPPRPSSAPPTLEGTIRLAEAPAEAADADGGAPASGHGKRAASQAFLATLRELTASGDVAGGGKKARERGAAPAAPPRRSSVFRGVTRHRWTGRYEAHLWDAASERAPGSTRGRQKARPFLLVLLPCSHLTRMASCARRRASKSTSGA